MYRLEAERKDLQEKEDAYCRYVLQVADRVMKFKSEVKVCALKYCKTLLCSLHLNFASFEGRNFAVRHILISHFCVFLVSTGIYWGINGHLISRFCPTRIYAYKTNMVYSCYIVFMLQFSVPSLAMYCRHAVTCHTVSYNILTAKICH